MPPPEPTARLGLVGSGPGLIRALEALKDVPNVEIVVVADASGHSDGARLARSLGISLVTNPMDVFRTNANVILELSGQERQYQRLLAIKPSGVEVMSARGARLLIDLLKRGDSPPRAGDRAKVLVIVAATQVKLYDYLSQGLSGIREVETLLDRRQGQRRQRVRAQVSERRLADRRRQPGIDAELQSRGFVITRLQARVAGD